MTSALGAATEAEAEMRLKCFVGIEVERVVCSATWRRGGAETYIVDLEAKCNNRTSSHLVLKALIPDGGYSEEYLNGILCRRNLIKAAGLETPRLMGAKGGYVIEERIEYSIESREIEVTNSVWGSWLRRFSKLGFASTGIVRDLRSRGSDIVIVDFGADLGSALSASRSEARERICSELGVLLDAARISIIRALAKRG